MKRLFGLLTIITLCFTLAGCGEGFDTPEFKTLEPSQTGFLIPLEGKTSDQAVFGSEKFLESSKVATKRIQIPHRAVKLGYASAEWMPTMTLIVVERKPETRAWTESRSTGTSNKNEGIVAESKESIGFMSRMNCSAQIDEEDATKFLYRYNNKPLSEIMDNEIRARIESAFVAECAKRSLSEFLLNKGIIMEEIRKDVVPYFKERGINVTTIGMKGELTYLNADIQKAIDNKFKTAQALISQNNENERIVSKSKADAESIKIQASTIAQTIKLKELDNQRAAIDKWNGATPTVVSGSGGMMLNIPPIK